MLTDKEMALLEAMENNFPMRAPVKSPERDSLQRDGLIESYRPPLHARNRRIRWRLTDAGREVIQQTEAQRLK